MSNTASLKKEYAERIAPALKNQFQYSSSMQIPVLKKIVINQGLGMAVADKKIIEVAINELTAITGQKAVATVSRKDIANFKLRKKMPIGVMVTLRRERMYEFLEKLVRVALPRIRDFKGIESKFDMHLTQPAVTKQIQALEALYGVRLFTYDSRKLRKTPQGETLEIYAISQSLLFLPLSLATPEPPGYTYTRMKTVSCVQTVVQFSPV